MTQAVAEAVHIVSHAALKVALNTHHVAIQKVSAAGKYTHVLRSSTEQNTGAETVQLVDKNCHQLLTSPLTCNI